MTQATLDIPNLRLILWPDPRLKKLCQPVTLFDARLAALGTRMLELMRIHKGVGLAAPQVGINLRVFVMNATGEPEDDRVYVNPMLTEAEGDVEGEEGCLSLPGIDLRVVRSERIRLQGFDVAGNPVDVVESDFPARIWQHEIDHLNGTLLLDRMGPVARMTSRRILKELEERYADDHPTPAASKKRSTQAKRH